jgi:uncharacterized protein YggE
MSGTTMTMRAFGVAGTAICLCLGGTVRAAAAIPGTITVTGTGVVSGVPDELQLALDADAEAASVSAALDGANKAMTAVRDALTADGVAAADLQTTGMSVQPRYDQQNAITGYTVSESLTAELHDLAKAGKAITGAVDAGGNAVRVDQVSLDLTDQTATLMGRARAKAIADAKARAGQYAQAAGVRLGPVLSISETSGSVAPGPVFPGAVFAAESAVPISAGTQQVTASVVVEYQLAG